MANCSGINCPMKYGAVDPATCPAISFCPHATPPRTNGDRIRAKKDGELAYFLHRCADCRSCEIRLGNCGKSDITCQKRWLDWLKQEAE